MRVRELEKILRDAGCYPVREGDEHTIWKSPISGNKFPVSRHKSEDVKKGTLNKILKQAGLK